MKHLVDGAFISFVNMGAPFSIIAVNLIAKSRVQIEFKMVMRIDQSGKDDKVIRFCFAKKEETLERAAERLIKI